MTRRVSVPALVAHHLRSHAGGGAVVAALVLILALIASAAPLALGILGDAALRDRLGGLSATERDVIADVPGAPQLPSDIPAELTTEEVWGSFAAAVDGIRAGAEAPLPSILGEARVVTLSSDNPLAESPRTQELTVAFAPGYEDEIRIVEGRLPVPAAPADASGSSSVEVVLSTETASQLEWSVGESRTITAFSGPMEVVLVGVFEAVDPDADYWQHVPSVLEPKIFDDGNAPRRTTGTAFAHPASLATAHVPGVYTTRLWYPTDVDGVDAADAEQTVAALRQLTSVSHTIGSSADGVGILSLRFDAEVTSEIELALAQRESTEGVIAMLVAGPVGVAAAVLLLGCRLILERRRPSLRLLSARGASAGQLRAILGTEGVLVGLLPALLGAVIVAVAGAVVLGAPPAAAGIGAALLIGLTPVVILILLAPSVAERPARADLGRTGSRLRLIVEGVVVGLAVVGLVLLFVRGYSAGVDPLLAATPLLLSLVACLITLRVYPLPLAALHARARRAVGLDGFLGSARALREPAIGLTPVLALVVGVSVAVSSGILLSALQSGITEASRAQIGADMRVTGASFTREQMDRVQDIDGVAAATGISGAEPATLDINGQKRATSAFVVDAAELRAVQGDGPGMLPPGVSLEPVDGGTMPIVVSGFTADLIDGSTELRLGGVDAEVVGVTSGPVPIGTRENWVSLDASYAEEVLGRDPADRTVLVRLDDGASPGAVEAGLVEVLGQDVRIDTADEIASRIESGPAVQGVRIALLAATAVAALLSALAIVMTLSLVAGARARVLALLRTLGAPRRASTSLALWEIGPPTVAAIIAGTIFGALVPLVVLAAVDLRPFTGSSVAPAYRVDPAILALTLGGFVVVAAALTALTLLVSRRIRAAGALRTVEEG